MLDERIKHARRVAAAADAGDHHVGQAAELFAALLDRFSADDRLKIADDQRKRMRADDGADDVMRGCRRDAIQSRIASLMASRSVREPLVTGRTSAPSSLHAEDVELLAADVFFAHVDDAFQAEVGTGGGGGHAVLAGAGLGDHAVLAHAQREQRLAERVVDLVGAGVVQVFALQVDLRPAALFGEPLGEIERATGGRRSA